MLPGNPRSEANKLPLVFIAQDTSVTEDGSYSSVRYHHYIEDGESTAESRREGTYSDGVYVAPRIEEKVNSSSTGAEQEEHEEQEAYVNREKEGLDAQEVYYNLLRHRFLLLRSTLKCSPPSSSIAALDKDRPISLPVSSRKARLEWRRLLQMTEPQMVQLACMDAESVLRIIAIVTRSLSEAAQSEEAGRVKRLGAWAWGLLGKCREVGQMGSEEVAEIRELGKRAVKILVKLRSPEMRRALEEASRQGGGAIEESEDEGGTDQEESDNQDRGPAPDRQQNDGEGHTRNSPSQDQEYPLAEGTATGQEASTSETAQGESSQLETAKARLRQKLEIESKSVGLEQHIFAMFDMIISVVGEFYGQRDLLEFRDIWEEDKS